MNQLDPNVAANARYRMNTRLEDARRLRDARAVQGQGKNLAAIDRVPRKLGTLVTRFTTKLRGRRSSGTMRARALESDVGADQPRRRADRPGEAETVPSEAVIAVLDSDPVVHVEVDLDTEIARSGHPETAKSS